MKLTNNMKKALKLVSEDNTVKEIDLELGLDRDSYNRLDVEASNFLREFDLFGEKWRTELVQFYENRDRFNSFYIEHSDCVRELGTLCQKYKSTLNQLQEIIRNVKK